MSGNIGLRSVELKITDCSCFDTTSDSDYKRFG